MVLKAGLLVLKRGDKCYYQDICLTGCSMKVLASFDKLDLETALV